MTFSFFVQICLPFVVSLALLISFQFSRYTRLYHLPTSLLHHGFGAARLNLAFRLIITTIAILIPFYFYLNEAFTPWDIVIPLLFSVVLGLFINPELRAMDNNKLLITAPFLSKTAILHLNLPYQQFDRATYQELLHLIETLPIHGIRHIKLTSPMFYRANGKLRSMQTLGKILTKSTSKFTHAPAKKFDILLGRCCLLIATDKRKSEGLANINLLNWHTIYIDIQKERYEHNKHN